MSVWSNMDESHKNKYGVGEAGFMHTFTLGNAMYIKREFKIIQFKTVLW